MERPIHLTFNLPTDEALALWALLSVSPFF